MRAFVRGCAVLAPGWPDWATAARVLRGDEAYVAAPVGDLVPLSLPANERRRVPETARWALAVGMQALRDAGVPTAQIATVFASCGSDGPITHQICTALAQSVRAISPTQFHNSVHNAPGGYWSIALGSHAPSTSLCAGEATFAAGLIEACAQVATERRDVLLIAYDIPYPEPLARLWTVAAPFASAWLLCGEGPGPALDLAIVAEGAEPAWPAGVPDAWRGNPAAACLPLLAQLARAEAGTAILRYLDAQVLAVSLQP